MGEVLHVLHRTVVTKRELSWKAKLSIYRPNLRPYPGHERWVMTERKRSWVQAAEMGFLHMVAGVSLRDRVRALSNLKDCWGSSGPTFRTTALHMLTADSEL